mmetsp:Transcript_19853/g.40345  ORF Transcript_19853/g.40345 Transcript_19853/m.40345 type:complete len:113 (+) Transcript_19853:1824-2162(+)
MKLASARFSPTCPCDSRPDHGEMRRYDDTPTSRSGDLRYRDPLGFFNRREERRSKEVLVHLLQWRKAERKAVAPTVTTENVARAKNMSMAVAQPQEDVTGVSDHAADQEADQ